MEEWNLDETKKKVRENEHDVLKAIQNHLNKKFMQYHFSVSEESMPAFNCRSLGPVCATGSGAGKALVVSVSE